MKENSLNNTKTYSKLLKNILMISFLSLIAQGAFGAHLSGIKNQLLKNRVVPEKVLAALVAEEVRLKIMETTPYVVSQEALQMLALEEVKLKVTTENQMVVVPEVCALELSSQLELLLD